MDQATKRIGQTESSSNHWPKALLGLASVAMLLGGAAIEPTYAQQGSYVGSQDGEFQLTGMRPGRKRCSGCPKCRGVRPCPDQAYSPADSYSTDAAGTPDAPLPEGDFGADFSGDLPNIQDYAQPSPGALASNFGASSAGDSMAPTMIGDFVGTPIAIPIVGMTGPNAPIGGAATFSNPFLTRTFKVVEGQSPVPQNRVYGRFNFFDRVDNNDANLFRYVIGFERTFLDGQASYGLLLPFYTVDQGTFAQPSGAAPVGPMGFGTNSGSAGDLSAIVKYALYQNPTNGSVLSVGLTITAPTGPRTIAGIDPVIQTDIQHWGTIQPWWGFLKTFDNSNWFIQGFNAVDQPFYAQDATLMFTDVGFGYYLKRDRDAFITALVPTVEAHSSNPLGNRTLVVSPVANSGIFFTDTTARLGDQLNLTTGITALVRRKTALTLGVVTPMVGPQPFDWELQLQLSYYPRGTGRLPGPRFLPN